jgi:Flp pilus assembly protein TadG
MVEFALTLPLLLLLLLFGLDFGRAFLGWVNLNNTVRIASNFASLNPNAWNIGSPNAVAQAEYIRLIQADAAGINCAMPNPPPPPTFPSGKDIGSAAHVVISCDFSLITPLIGDILGDPLPVTASAAFPIRSGAILGVPVQTTTVTSTSTSTTSTGTTTTTTSTTAMCTVPDFTANPRNTSQAPAKWSDAGFTTNVIFDPLVPPNYNIGAQSLSPDELLPCDSTSVTVYP